MIELKITGDALEVKSEIEKLFNMTSGVVAPVVGIQKSDEQKIDILVTDKEKALELAEECEQKSEVALKVAEETPEFDKRGMPWDERIHASSKSINADGTWRNKRGIDKETLEAVEKELFSVNVKIGELIVDGKEHTAKFEGDTEAALALQSLPAEVTFKDVQGALVKAISAMKDVKDTSGVPVIGNFSQKLMAKFNVSNINELVNQDDRAEFVEVCNNIISTPDQWETFL